MPRQMNPIRSYLLHKKSGQARVRIAGREFLLGPFGSEASRIRYGELVAKCASGVPIDPLAASSNRGMNRGTDATDPGPSIAELIVASSNHVEQHCVKNGEPTSEQWLIRELLALTTAMLDGTGSVWKAALVDHKCQHHGQSRTLHFGPKAQLILAKNLSADPDKPLFKMTHTAYCRAITRGCESPLQATLSAHHR